MAEGDRGHTAGDQESTRLSENKSQMDHNMDFQGKYQKTKETLLEAFKALLAGIHGNWSKQR